VRIQADGSLAENVAPLPDAARPVIDQTIKFYKSVGWNFPWISYLAVEDGAYVGICAFKGPPKNNAVEIAYHTFPAHEGRGIATEMAAQLCSIAKTAAPSILVTAQTRPEENASTRVLRKLGFIFKGSVIDHEIGPAWEWSAEKRTLI
jgi:RimJ/RimL family protein N-acetyltransferase